MISGVLITLFIAWIWLTFSDSTENVIHVLITLSLMIILISIFRKLVKCVESDRENLNVESSYTELVEKIKNGVDSENKAVIEAAVSYIHILKIKAKNYIATVLLTLFVLGILGELLLLAGAATNYLSIERITEQNALLTEQQRITIANRVSSLLEKKLNAKHKRNNLRDVMQQLYTLGFNKPSKFTKDNSSLPITYENIEEWEPIPYVNICFDATMHEGSIGKDMLRCSVSEGFEEIDDSYGFAYALEDILKSVDSIWNEMNNNDAEFWNGISVDPNTDQMRNHNYGFAGASSTCGVPENIVDNAQKTWKHLLFLFHISNNYKYRNQNLVLDRFVDNLEKQAHAEFKKEYPKDYHPEDYYNSEGTLIDFDTAYAVAFLIYYQKISAEESDSAIPYVTGTNLAEIPIDTHGDKVKDYLDSFGTFEATLVLQHINRKIAYMNDRIKRVIGPCWERFDFHDVEIQTINNELKQLGYSVEKDDAYN